MPQFIASLAAVFIYMVMLMSLPSLGQTSQHTTSGPEVLHTEEEPTSPPKIDDDDAFYDFVGDASEWSAEVLHALNSVMCEFNVKSVDIPQVPVSAVSDCRVDVPQASDNPAVDTVAPQSSQLKDDEETIMGQFATTTLT